MLILIFLFLLALGRPVAAQDLTFSRAYDDYVFTTSNYQKVHQEYELAKNAYLQNPTLKLQSEAQDKTAQMLTSRDEVLRVYFTALRTKLSEAAGLTLEEKSSLFARLDAEVAWYAGHKSVYHAADSLVDLTNKSAESASRYSTTSEVLIWETLFAVADGQVRDLRGRQETVLTAIKTKVDEIDVQGGKDTQLVKRWYDDIEDRFKKSEEAELLAIEKMAKIGDRTGAKKSVYNDGIQTLASSFSYLKEANDFLKEVVREIMTHD